MMGRSHVTVGICGVVLASSAQVIDWSVPNVAALVSGCVLAGTVWPDIDHHTSTVTRSFGPVTGVLSDIVRFISRRVYRWTRLPHDPPNRDPHRTFTHTWPGALLAGAALSGLLVADRWAASVAIAMLFGMAARAWSKGYQPFAALVGGAFMYDLWPAMGGSFWALSLAFAAGCWLHVYSDCVTTAGAPMAWPRVTMKREYLEDGTARVVQRRRWHMTGPPHWLRFYAGSPAEKWIVRGSVVLTATVSYYVMVAL